MKKLKLCNVHRLALSNEGEERKPIHIPFGTWDYDDRITQTLDREHAQAIANELQTQIAAGEPGIPVYQGHPDVPEYAGKYPDKGALGWVKKILVNEDGMDLEVEWDRDPGKGFGWFSPYWTGDNPTVGSDGKKNVVIDGLTSIGLVNNPNIREFRLANEAGENLTQRCGEAEVAAFKLPDHLLALAKRFDDRAAMPNEVNFDESKHPRDEDGKFSSGGGGGGGGKAIKGLEYKDSEGQLYSVEHVYTNMLKSGRAVMARNTPRAEKSRILNAMMNDTRRERGNYFEDLFGPASADVKTNARRNRRATVKALHVAAIMGGLKYNRATHQYE